MTKLIKHITAHWDKCLLPAILLLWLLTFSFNTLASNLVITLENASTAGVLPGATDQEIVYTAIEHLGGGSPHSETVTAMNFTAVNTLNADVVLAVKLYYTLNTTTFSTAELLDTDADFTDGITFTFSKSITRGNIGYFWLAYDIAGGAICGNTVDATQVLGDITVSGTVNSYTDNATGNRAISPVPVTTLSAGDIAIIGYNATNPDQFTFVVLTAMAEGEQIKFTDNGWLSGGGFRAGEGILIWTAPCGGLTCGTEVTVTDLENPFSVSSGTITDDGSFLLAILGDQILAYQGPEASPTFIFGLNNSNVAGAWDADAADAQTSALPTGLTDGTNAVGISPQIDNLKYDCSTTTGTQAELLTAICTAGNWGGSTDPARVTLPTPCTFTCGAGSETCFDNILNNGEVSVDCGGTNCPACECE